MGIGFVILVYLVSIFILSTIIAIIAVILVFAFSKKGKRRRKILFATISPYLTLYSFYILFLIGDIIVSVSKDVDMGIGDYWYVPISEDCKLSFIDLPENSFIECEDQTIINGISGIQESGSEMYIDSDEDGYFRFDVPTQKMDTITTFEYNSVVESRKLQMVKAYDFYRKRIKSTAGNYFIIVRIIAFLICVAIFIKAKKIMLK